MATQTTNLKLTKPSYSDVADISVLNSNFDIIDENLANKADKEHKHKMNDIEGLSLQAKNVSIEDTENLFTSTNVEGALSELFQNVSNGKSSIAKAITAKGVSASASDSFAILANKISQIISELLNIPFPNFSINVGTVDAIFDTLDSTFKEFRIEGQAWQTSNIFRSLEGNATYNFEGKYGGNRVSRLTVITPKANQSKPIAPTASNIEGDSITVTAPPGCKIRFNGSDFNSPHVFTNLNTNTLYEFFSFIPSTNNLNESPTSDALRVQTLDKIYLFKNGTKVLSDKSKWRKYRSTSSALWDIANTIKLDSKSASSATEIGIMTIDEINVTNYSKLCVVVSNLDRTGSDPNQDGGHISIIGNNANKNSLVFSAKPYEFDISKQSSISFQLYVEAWVNKRTIMEISEIYLAN